MASSNSVNCDSTGVVTYNATTGVFTGSTITEHNVLVAAAANAISSVAPGNAGNVLTSNGTDWASTALPSGTPVGGARSTLTTASATSTTTFLAASGAPTTSNTTLFTTLSYTAQSVANLLKIEISIPFAFAVSGFGGFFLFSGTTLMSSFWSLAITAGGGNATFTGYFTPASTSAITYSIYYAGNATGTMYILQSATGNNYTGSLNAYFQITEIIA